MITFVVDGKEGRFDFPNTAAWDKADGTLCSIAETWSNGAINYGNLCTKVDRIIDKFPDFLEAYQVKAAAAIELAQSHREDPSAGDLLRDAMVSCSKGLAIAKTKIPKDFKGPIIWGWLENRPFLRLHHSLILIHIENKDYRQAAKEILQHLKWNPNDNVGVRYLLGFVYYHAGEFTKAYKTMQKLVTKKGYITFPPYLYTMALIDFKMERYAEAATNLRLAFIDNTYIGEVLAFGLETPPEHNLSECGPFERLETVTEYAESGILKEWTSNEAAIDFARWLYNTAEATADRAALARYKNDLTFHPMENENYFIGEIAGEEFRRHKEKITVENTAPMIRRVQTWRTYKESVWPWEWLREKESYGKALRS